MSIFSGRLLLPSGLLRSQSVSIKHMILNRFTKQIFIGQEVEKTKMWSV
ncbi:MAG: hypothetical protein OEW48_16900 [Phycisphaerae bacterium]|nr:hypothetical protein [Phycisphaerae bacterium]